MVSRPPPLPHTAPPWVWTDHTTPHGDYVIHTRTAPPSLWLSVLVCCFRTTWPKWSTCEKRSWGTMSFRLSGTGSCSFLTLQLITCISTEYEKVESVVLPVFFSDKSIFGWKLPSGCCCGLSTLTWAISLLASSRTSWLEVEPPGRWSPLGGRKYLMTW